MSAAGRREQGMTLMEVLVVMAILGLIGTLGVVQLSRALSIYSLREATSTVVAQMKMARAQAIRSSQMSVFSATADGRAFASTGGVVRDLPSGVRFVEPGATVTFYADGTATGGPLTMGSGRGQLVLSVNAVTGAVAVTPQ